MNKTETALFWTMIRLEDRIADRMGEGKSREEAEILAADRTMEDLFQNASLRLFNAALRGSSLLRAAYDRAMALTEEDFAVSIGLTFDADEIEA